MKQPDFIITVSGQDVTKDCESWELNDVENGISNLTATVVNQDMKYSGAFKCEGKIEIRWGYQGELGPRVSMTIKEVTEQYSVRGLWTIATGMDGLERATGIAASGAFDAKEITKVLEEISKIIGMKLKLGDVLDPKFMDKYKQFAQNERLWDLMRRLINMLGTKSSAKKGSTPRAGGKKAIKQQKKPSQGNFKGKLGNLRTPTGPSTTTEEAESYAKHLLENATNEASARTVRASVELVGVPVFKAKTCATFVNVGPEASGKWYVEGVTHKWDVHRGYTTRASLIRSDDEQPVVVYADIYKEDSMEITPRKIDGGSQGTYSFGIDDKSIIDFKYTESVQPGKEAGEGGESQTLSLTNPEHKPTFQSK